MLADADALLEDSVQTQQVCASRLEALAIGSEAFASRLTCTNSAQVSDAAVQSVRRLRMKECTSLPFVHCVNWSDLLA